MTVDTLVFLCSLPNPACRPARRLLRKSVNVWSDGKTEIYPRLAAPFSSVLSRASSMPQYQMSTALLPRGWCDRVDRLFKDFWWGYFNDRRHYCPKAWDSICQPKHLGGLGLRRMHDCNLALVTKLGWKLLLQEDTLWRKSFSTRYFHNCSFWMASAGYNPSWCWRSILQARDTLLRGASFLPRDGTTISVLADPDHPT